MAEPGRYKKLENRRISSAKLANFKDGEPTSLLIRFTDGGTAVIDVNGFAEIAHLEIEVDGYK